jgi:hypothetical protein
MGSPPNPPPGWFQAAAAAAQAAQGNPASVNGHAAAQGTAAAAAAASAAQGVSAAWWDPPVGDFPEKAWRGTFDDYRQAMKGTSSASDVAHFTTLWATISVSLGRRFHMHQGGKLYPNVYLIYYGPTGDSKTTAQRSISYNNLLPQGTSMIDAAGSAEGLADRFAALPGGGGAFLFSLEEYCELLVRASWKGSGIDGLLIRCFDCPESYDLLYRKKPVHIVAPTPTMLAATTLEYFWRHIASDFFYGGLGNRCGYFTGKAKDALPITCDPDKAGIVIVRRALDALANVPSGEVRFTPDAEQRWCDYYRDFEQRIVRAARGLVVAATRRTRLYVAKLAMTYAVLEGTLPYVELDQLNAAIEVGEYETRCTEHLIDQQSAPAGSEADMTEYLLTYIQKHSGIEKRLLHRNTARRLGGGDRFRRTMDGLREAERIEEKRQNKNDPMRVYFLG